MYPLRIFAHHNNTSFTKLCRNNFVYDQINPLYHLYSRQYTKKKRMVNNICYSESTVISDLVYYHYLNSDRGSVTLSPYNKGFGYLKFLSTNSIYSIKSETRTTTDIFSQVAASSNYFGDFIGSLDFSKILGRA